MALSKKDKQAIFEKEELKRKLNLANKKTTSRHEDLRILADKTGNKAPIEKVIIEPEKTILEQHEDFRNDLQPEIKTALPIKETEVKTEPLKEDLEKRTLSLWDEIKTPTNEDLGIKDQVKETLSTVNNLAESATNNLDNLTDYEAEALAQKTSYKVKASIIVELCDVAFMVVCLVLTWDFADDNQKKFTLNVERKKAITFNLQKVYELEGKKLTPKKDILFLIIGSYVPMLLVAVFMLINRMKKKGEDKKNNIQYTILQMDAAKEAESLKNQLSALQYEKDILQSRITLSENSKGKFEMQKPKEFLLVPDLGRAKKEAKKRVFTGTGSGVKLGQKRGSYKKHNK